MDWNNVNLNSGYEADQNLLENYTFSQLLLEVHCNLKPEQLTVEQIKQHAQDVMKAKYLEGLEILNSNIDNIVAKAIKDRKDN